MAYRSGSVDCTFGSASVNFEGSGITIIEFGAATGATFGLNGTNLIYDGQVAIVPTGANDQAVQFVSGTPNGNGAGETSIACMIDPTTGQFTCTADPGDGDGESTQFFIDPDLDNVLVLGSPGSDVGTGITVYLSAYCQAP
jgi:hypothetical protein